MGKGHQLAAETSPYFWPAHPRRTSLDDSCHNFPATWRRQDNGGSFGSHWPWKEISLQPTVSVCRNWSKGARVCVCFIMGTLDSFLAKNWPKGSVEHVLFECASYDFHRLNFLGLFEGSPSSGYF